MVNDEKAGSERWINGWLDSIVGGRSTMSQRSMTAIAVRGGVETVVRLACAKGVHLVQLTGDRKRAGSRVNARRGSRSTCPGLRPDAHMPRRDRTPGLVNTGPNSQRGWQRARTHAAPRPRRRLLNGMSLDCTPKDRRPLAQTFVGRNAQREEGSVGARSIHAA